MLNRFMALAAESIFVDVVLGPASRLWSLPQAVPVKAQRDPPAYCSCSARSAHGAHGGRQHGRDGRGYLGNLAVHRRLGCPSCRCMAVTVLVVWPGYFTMRFDGGAMVAGAVGLVGAVEL